MTTLHRLSFVSVCLLLLAVSTRADFDIEAGINSGYIGNLYLDSNDVEDSYSTTRASFKYYPLPQMEIDLTSAYTYYSKAFVLSNFLYSGKITFIPTSEKSPFSVYLFGAYDNVQYREKREDIDNNNSRWFASLGFRLSPVINFRAGSRLTATRYPHSEDIDADHEKYELFAGINLSLFGSNSVDVEAGLGRIDFVFLDPDTEIVKPPGMGLPAEILEGNLRLYYITPRFSRPLGSRTGLSISYTYRQFTNPDEVLIFGFATEFLSPWASIYEGSSVTVKLKSYLIPHMVVTTGAGYWDKIFLTTLEKWINPAYGGEEWRRFVRQDYFTRLYISLQRPVSFGVSGMLEPTVTVDYSHNNSIDEDYDYSGTTVSVAIVYRR
jgi:hypothetical protein